MKVVVLFEDLKKHILEHLNVAERLVFNKFFENVLLKTTDIGISKMDMLMRHKFSERDIR